MRLTIRKIIDVIKVMLGVDVDMSYYDYSVKPVKPIKKSVEVEVEKPVKPKKKSTKKSIKTTVVDFPGEEWRDVPDYPEIYEVSNMGRVRSKRYGRLLSLRDGRQVILTEFSKSKSYTLRRLVADVFIPKPEISEHQWLNLVNINGDVNDNRAKNLRWEVQNRRNASKKIIVQMPVVAVKIEEWRDVSDYPNYEVSNMGRVRNKQTGNMLKPTSTRSVTLSNNNMSKRIRVIDLVADAFVPKPEISDNQKLKIKAKNNDKHDYRADNLMWIIVEDIKTDINPLEIVNVKPRCRSIENIDIKPTIAQYRSTGELVRKYIDIDDIVAAQPEYERDYIEALIDSGTPDFRNFIWKKI